MTYRPRRLRQAKTPISAAALRYFMAPVGSTDDFYRTCDEAKVTGDSDDLLALYYFDEWKEIWRDHRATIEAEWKRQFPPEQREAQRRWALQSYQARLNQRVLAQKLAEF